jgi:hypothetical protein
VLALIPTPGFPALAYVHPNGRLYAGTFENPAGDSVHSRVFEYTSEGTLLRSWTIADQDLAAAHGVQVATSDAEGRLLLLESSRAQALILDTRSGEQRVYARFAGLRRCSAAAAKDCAPTLRERPPAPDYAAWGPDGSLYVTDYRQAVVWRVPRGGGEPRIWLADRRLDGEEFGTTGIALAADRGTLLVSQQSSAGLGGGNPTTGKLYAVPIRPDGSAGPLRQLWESRPLDGPDGFAIARSGNIYIPLVLSAQIAVLAPDGHELERFPRTPISGSNGSPVPFDTPSSVRFLGTRLIVANQSFITANAADQALLDVETGEPGLPELLPSPPVVRAPRPARRRRHHRRHRPLLR